MAVAYDPETGLYTDSVTGGTSANYQTSIPTGSGGVPFGSLTDSGGTDVNYSKTSTNQNIPTARLTTFAPTTSATHSFSSSTYSKPSFVPSQDVGPGFDGKERS